MNKKITNAGLGAGLTVGSIPTVVEIVLDRIGQVQTAIAIKEFFTIYPGINWQPIWLALFIFCALLLVAVNFELIVILCIWLFQKPLYMSGASAATYIAYWTELGSSWPGPQKMPEALKAMQNAAWSGRLTLRGRPSNGDGVNSIPASRVQFTDFVLMPHGGEQALVIIDQRTHTPIYSGVLANQNEVKKIWKNSRSTAHFLGWNDGES